MSHRRLAVTFVAALAALPVLAQQVQPIDSLEVVGRRQSGEYHATEASGATRSEAPLREVPQAVRVVPRQLVDDLGATRLEEVYDYVSGVARQNNFGGLWDNMSIRGFAGDVNTGMSLLVNGFAGNRGFNAPRDTANVERIEFLKGPATALYGSSEPGGTINIVSKRPQFRAATSVEAYAGSFESYRFTLDSTGPLAGDVAYRLNVAAEDKRNFRDFIATQRLLVAPALTWRLADTTIRYDGEFLRHESPFDRGVVAVQGRTGAIPVSRFLGEPADGDVKVENGTHQLSFEREFGEGWRTRGAIGYKEGTLKGYSTEATALLADNVTLRRQRRFRDYSSNDYSGQAEIGRVFEVGGLKHDVLAGIEAYRFEIDQLLLRVNPTAAAPYAINIQDPVYGQAQPTPLPNTDTFERQRNAAFFVQDLLGLSARWKALLGLRFDRFDQRLENRRTSRTTTQEQNATSPRAGLTFLADAEWSLYATASQSFRPNAGTDAGGGAFEPESGRALEAGAKYESADKRIGATLAFYDIRKKNVLTSDPANAGFSVAAGEVRSRGIELDLSGQITRRLRLSASAALVDAEVTRDNTIPVGTRLLNVARTSANLLLVHEDSFAGGGRYGVGGGATYMGSRAGDALATFDLPAYTTAKFVAYWRATPQLRVSFDVDNVFDKDYYVSSFSTVWITPGASRTATLGVQYKF